MEEGRPSPGLKKGCAIISYLTSFMIDDSQACLDRHPPCGYNKKMQERALKPEPDSSDGIDSSTLEWVGAAQAGQRLAFHRLIDRFENDIFRMIFYRVRSRMDAEDLTQDVFLRAYNHLHRLKNRERFKSWLYSIALNQVRDFLRKKRRRSLFGMTVESEESLPPPEGRGSDRGMDAMWRRDFWKNIDELLKRLPKMEREVFSLRFLDQLSIKEVAEVLGKSESTVKTHLYRGLKKFQAETGLRDYLEETLS
ncbi:MAG: RNA polymerase sigma factor [Desulfatiglans sp.]|nr:RNA polymerase sigma factor [Desulfatiglans sp.]